MEPFLLTGDDLLDVGARGCEVRVRLPHRLDDRVDHLRHDGAIHAEQPRVTDRASKQTPKDVPASLIAGDNAVADQESSGARVLGDDPERDVGLLVLAVPPRGHLLRARDDRAQQVRVVCGRDVLQDLCQPLEPQARVDVPLGKVGDAVALVVDLELSEDQVVELHDPVAVLEPFDVAVLRTAVVEELGARPAGAGDAHPPEVVVGVPADDPVGRHTHDVTPDLNRIVVVFVRRDPDAFGIETEGARR